MVSAPVAENVGSVCPNPVNRSPAKHSLARHGIWVFVGRLTNVAIAALSTFVVARLLTQDEFGRFSTMLAITQMASLIGIFGLDQAVLREVGKMFAKSDPTRFRPLLRAFAHLSIWTLAACILTCFLFLWFAGPSLIKESIAPYAFAGTVLFTVARAAIQIAGETARALDDPLAANLLGGAAGGALGTAGFLILLWIASVCGVTDWGTAMCLYFAASTAPLLMILFRLSRSMRQFQTEDTETTERISLATLVKHTAIPLFLISVIAFISARADVLLLSAYRPPGEVAIYEAARRLTLLLTIPLGLMNMVVVSSISRLYEARETESLQKTLRIASAIASIPCLIACLLFAFFPTETLSIILGPKYASAATVLRLLIPGQLAIVLTGTCGLTLIHTGHTKVSCIISIFAPVILLSLGPYIADVYGAIGVASLTSVALMLQNGTNWAYLAYKTSIWTHPSYSLLFSSIYCRLRVTSTNSLPGN